MVAKRVEMHGHSDIDLLILVDKDKIKLEDEERITYPLYDIEIETGVIINPIVYSQKLWEGLSLHFMRML